MKVIMSMDRRVRNLSPDPLDKRLGELLQIRVLEGGVLQARPHNLPPTEEMADKQPPCQVVEVDREEVLATRRETWMDIWNKGQG